MTRVSGILLVLFLVSCETNMTDDDWPEHDPKLVIVAALRITSDSVYVYCRVSRTMGLGEKFNEELAIVNDADVYLLDDGKELEIPFSNPQENDPLLINANYQLGFPRSSSTKYTLNVRNGELYTQSTLSITSVPLTFDSIEVHYLGLAGNYPQFRIQYTLTTPIKRMYYDILIEEQQTSGLWREELFGNPWSFFSEWWNNPATGSFSIFLSSNKIRKWRYRLMARSPEFSDYKNSLRYMNFSGSPFEPEAKNPAFNFTGDGIGFFWFDLVGDPVEFDY